MSDSRTIKESLDRLLSENDTVFIVPHNRPDMDAIGSAIGMALICKKNKKKYFIVIDDDVEKLEVATKKVIKDISNEFIIIKASEINELLTNKSLMIAVDVNKDYLISTRPYLDLFNEMLRKCMFVCLMGWFSVLNFFLKNLDRRCILMYLCGMF